MGHLALLILAVGLADADFAAAQLPPGQALLPPTLPRAKLAGKHAMDALLERVGVSGTSFPAALRVATLKQPPYPWDIRLAEPTLGAIHAGDVLLASFQARRIKSKQETGEALLELVVEETGGEHRKLLELSTSVGPEWTLIQSPFVADKSLAAGEAQVSLRFGFAPQEVELTAVALTNYGASVALKDLPRRSIRYAGWEPDAPWRKAAAGRIELIRKGGLTVIVTNATGQPVSGAQVSVRMKRHAFAFGSAVTARGIAETGGADGERYRQTIEKYFNKVVFENNLKWDAWLTNRPGGAANRERTLQAIEWLRARDIPIRGHVIVWPSWQYVPGFVSALKANPTALRQAVEDHIADQTSVLRGKLVEWDVINESYAHHDVLDILGRGEMARWFRLARQEDAGVKLFYNDYLMFAGSGPGSPSQYFFDTVKFLQDEGAPLDAIGEQGHFGGSPPSPIQVLAAFDRFAALGLPIQISEFDVDTSDAELQAAYTRDFLTAAFSHPSVLGVMSWGFWEGAHWKPRAAMWARDWTVRPHGQVWLDLVTRHWWTNADGITAADGRFSMRGFCGEYEVTAQAGGTTVQRRVSLPQAGTVLHLGFP